MKEQVFVDSGFWIALLDRKDQNHQIATNHLKPLLLNYRVCLSDFIVFERQNVTSIFQTLFLSHYPKGQLKT